jgi:uncharacterized membrane protein
MTEFLIGYAIATLTLFVLDFIWLGFVAKNFYFSQLGHLMLDKPKLGIAAAFYLTYTVGVVILAVLPALGNGSVMQLIGYSALFGFLAYGTYDFTNMSTLKDWPTKMSIVDLIWGTSLTVVTALVTYYGLSMLGY